MTEISDPPVHHPTPPVAHNGKDWAAGPSRPNPEAQNFSLGLSVG